MEKYLITILSLSLPGTRAAADWSTDGIPLYTIEHGTVNGGIYIGGGHGKEYTTTYARNFTVPNGTVKRARLYVSAKDTPWINVSLNGHLPGNYTDLAGNPKVYANYRTGVHGMYWAYFLGSRVGLNTKSWGIMLIAKNTTFGLSNYEKTINYGIDGVSFNSRHMFC